MMVWSRRKIERQKPVRGPGSSSRPKQFLRNQRAPRTSEVYALRHACQGLIDLAQVPGKHSAMDTHAQSEQVN